jgi:hypothetical protein
VSRRRLQRPHPQKRRVPGAQPSKSKPEERFLSTQADRSRRANGKKKSACFARNDRWDNREKVGENCGVWAFLGLGWSR